MGSQGALPQLMLLLAATAAAAAAQAKRGCQDSCGDISIPYPFGTTEDCYLNDEFLITCDNSTKPPKAFLTRSPINVTEITLGGELHILALIARSCYNSTGGLLEDESIVPEFTLSKFRVSGTLNKFVAVGCDTYALFSGYKGEDLYRTGCMSMCSNESQVQDGTCSGAGCCLVSIPEGLENTALTLSSYYNHTDVWGFNPCSYAFFIEEEAFHFSSQNLTNLRHVDKLPTVVDWSIGNQTCEEAQKDLINYACKENSTCHEPKSLSGYLCKCWDGYEGNPYLDGCQDIDECETLRPCNGTCENLAGSFNCSCPHGYEGDGNKNGTGCAPIVTPSHRFPWIVILGIGVTFLVLLLVSSWAYWWLRQREIIQLKEKFFEQNGGIMLRQQLSKHEGSIEAAKIFRDEDLKKATNNYHESGILGQGGQGTVYKGILADSRVVAIKKSKIMNRSQVDQFINEVIVLSQVNHRNVVKLLGCCLETEVPLLVYEFVSNGTLSSHIHETDSGSSISWGTRLRIASETAGALSYLHSAASTPIIHRDVKSANILLDENHTAKVSDFGASRLIPLDQSQLATMVQGTFGYLDPEYFHSSLLTEKSDVYSFGVLLVELLTGKKALCFERPEKERHLATHFLSSMKEDRLFEILDGRAVNEKNFEQFKEVAMLAKRCLKIKGDERPTMKEVAMELEGLRIAEKHPWVESDLHAEETECLLEVPNTYDGCSSSNATGYDSLRNEVKIQFDGGR